MPTIMDYYNTGLAAAQNQTRGRYLDPMLKAQLYDSQTRNKYLDPMLQAQLYDSQTRNKYLDPTLAAALHNQEIINRYLPREKEANIASTQATTDSTRQKTKYPLLGQAGVLGQIGGAMYLQDTGASLPGYGTPTNMPAPPPSVPTGGGLGAPMGAPSQVMPPQMVGSPPPMVGASGNPPMPPSAPPSPLPVQQPSAPMGAAPQAPQGGLGQPVSLPQLVMQGVDTQLQQKQAFANYRNKQTEAYNYMSLPVDNKSQLIAQAAGMGYDPTQATNLFMSGNSIEDLARAKGFDTTNLPDPIYPTTKTSLTQIQKRQQALSEINNLNPKLNSAIAPYSNRIMGYSPKQIGEALSGTNKDSQAKFLAARALMPEMAALRGRAMTANVGIETIREITDASMGHVKVLQPFVDPEVFKKANDYVDEWINEAVTAANRAGVRPAKAATPSGGKDDPLGLLGNTNADDPLGLLK